jgi:hypothetical protein
MFDMTLNCNNSHRIFPTNEPHRIELTGDFAMTSIDNEKRAEPSMVAWLDRVQLSDRDREMAKAYLRSSEALLDLIWLVGARIREVFARPSAMRTPVASVLGGQDPAVGQLP